MLRRTTNQERILIKVAIMGAMQGLVVLLSVGRVDAIQNDRLRLVVQTGHGLAVTAAGFSPDGARVVTASHDATIRVWDAATGKQLRAIKGHQDWVTSAQFSPAGTRIVTASKDDTVRIWDTETGRQLRQLPGHEFGVISADFTPDGRRIVTTGFDETARIWDAGTGRQLRRFRGHSDSVNAAGFTVDGKRLVTASDDATARIWNAETGRQLRQLAGHDQSVRSAEFSKDGRRVVTASDDKTVRIWDAETGEQLLRLTGHTDRLSAASFSPDGSRVVTSSWDHTIRIWDAHSGQQLRQLAGHRSSVFDVEFSHDGKHIVSAGFDTTARIWDAGTGNLLRQLKGHNLAVRAAEFSRDRKRIVTAIGEDPAARIWDNETGKQNHQLEGHAVGVLAARFSPNGERIITTSFDNTARVWDVPATKQLRQLVGHSESIWDARFSTDGKRIVTASWDKTARIWDAATGRQLGTLNGHRDRVHSAAFSRDGKRIVTGSWDATARIWDADTTRELLQLRGHAGDVNAAHFSPQGTRIVTASQDGTARVWDVETGREVRQLIGHTDWVNAAEFSPDGKRIVTASRDKTARIWDADTGNELRQLSGHTSFVNAATYSNNGEWIITASWDSTTRIWNAATGSELCQLISFQDGWAVTTPDGRFDSNDLDDIEALHWVATDEPLRPLPIEIFMRDYFEPGLLSRLLKGERLPTIRSLAQLNRVQPKVKIVAVNRDPEHQDRVGVTVELAEQSRDFLRDGKRQTTHSGLEDVRLLRDGQLVAYAPQRDGAIRLNANGTTRLEFRGIKLPRDAGKTEVEFSAYAFNSDRVKSLTDRLSYELPQLAPRKGTAYVISIGVNSFEDSRRDLAFAVADARLIASAVGQRLQANGQFSDVVVVQLLSDKLAQDGSPSTATRDFVRQVLSALAGLPPSDSLTKQVPAAARIKEAHPEDLVLISFSTHGHNGDNGEYYLFPSDTGKGNLEQIDDWGISTDDLTLWLRDVDAGEMVMIVDACQAAATVEQAGFKPGPMGSRGLGQLAYDKRMRILSASESDRPAYERADLGHGLLTYALVQNGLIEERAATEGTITLGGWLKYAEQRVPQLYHGEVLKGQLTTAKGDLAKHVRPIVRQGATPRFQQPALFDFAKGNDEVILVK